MTMSVTAHAKSECSGCGASRANCDHWKRQGKMACCPECRHADPELLPPPLPEEAMVESDAAATRAFVEALYPWFRTASEIQREVKSEHERARTWPASETVDEDAERQLCIRVINDKLKSLADHWKPAKTPIYALWKALTGAETRLAKTLQDAKDIHQRDVNRFEADRQARKRAEDERLRREAEERARLEREAELARLEAAALAAEASSPALSDRETMFVRLVVAGASPESAARQAGFKTPGNAILQKPKIAAAVHALRDATRHRAEKERAAQAPVQAAPIQESSLDVAAVTNVRYIERVEIVDEAAFCKAAVSGKFGIPADCVKASQAGLNTAVKTLGSAIENWPGVRYERRRSNS